MENNYIQLNVQIKIFKEYRISNIVINIILSLWSKLLYVLVSIVKVDIIKGGH